MSSIAEMRAAAIADVNAANGKTPPAANDVIPSIPSAAASLGGGNASGDATDTVAQAYLAALSAQTKNTAGDTAPYVVIPNQADTGGGVSIVMVLVVVALGVAAWWFIKKRGGA
jgi:uncharacterized protein HemX